jgi:hypothetical protein
MHFMPDKVCHNQQVKDLVITFETVTCLLHCDHYTPSLVKE